MEEAFSNRTKVEKVRMAKESQLSLKGGMMELKKDGTCNTIIALLGAGKENCYRPERPIQVPLFDESGENVEDKRKREKEEAARIAAEQAAREEAERLAASQNYASSSNGYVATVNEDNIGSMVWITKTGSKYHSHGNCGNSKYVSQVTRESAEARGLDPCSKCY